MKQAAIYATTKDLLQTQKIRQYLYHIMATFLYSRKHAQQQQAYLDANARLQRTLRCYVSPPIAQRLLDSEVPPQLGGQYTHATILFLDISDFSSLAYATPAAEVLQILNRFLSPVSQHVIDAGGYIDKFMGDGFMAIFDAGCTSEHATAAVSSALAIQQVVAEHNCAYRPEFQVRIGIHSGSVVLGNVGTPQLMNYTAIGHAVNTAKRLEEIAISGTTLIGDATYALLNLETLNHASFDYWGDFVLKSRESSFGVYRVR